MRTLDSLYRDFFADNLKLPAGLSASDKHCALLEHKNRNFKDLHNLIEESILKFYDLYVEA